MDKKQKNSTAISLALHILVLWAAFSLHSAQILVPSRSNGMEVSLISPEALNLPPPTQVKTPVQETYHTQSLNADINIKQPEKKPPTKPVKTAVAKPIIKPVPIPSPKPKIDKPARLKMKKSVTSNQLNDILGTLTPVQNAGHSRGAALGGNEHGTSNTDNLNNNYADLVIARVRPYVVIPDGLTPDSTAIIEVIILPDLHIYQVTLVKSSGNSAYDDNVQQAVNRVAIFPPLPDGAKYSDYRKIRLTFRPE